MQNRTENRVLAELPPADAALLAPCLHPVGVIPGPTQQPEFPSDCVYFPDEGQISALALTSDGETIEIASAGREGCLGPIFPSDLHDGLLVALGPLRAFQVPVARLQPILAQSEALSQALAACREALLLQVRQNLVCGGLHPVERRLPRWLIETADRLESDVIPATQETVAQRLGVRRTTVTLLASKLQEIGAIHWGRSRVEILDRARLESETCTCQRMLRARVSARPATQLTVARRTSFGT
ncbi:MAG TPA: Crp/Fnr family transcriptional regulator [Xanthobacteraceae bacterium]|nr:Crp/Fnr family transcriptional regulator [Xanthobacteraceae bacterium]